MNIYPIITFFIFTLLWYYTSFKWAVLSIILLLIVLARSWPQEFKYHVKIWTYYTIFMSSTVVYLPFFFLHPFSYDNFRHLLRYWKQGLRIFRIKVETRDLHETHIDGPAVILSNHQSSFDLISLVHTVPARVTVLAKKEIKYMGSFGLTSYLCNIIFVDRSNHHKAIETMSKVATIMHENQVNVLIYPEGTRNMNGSLLPFKKGAFHLAIQAQVPLLPIVSSSYASFLDHKNKRFDTGRVIARCLPKVETKGLKAEDVDELMNRVRDQMLKVFLELTAEVMQDYNAYDNDSNPTATKGTSVTQSKTKENVEGLVKGGDEAMESGEGSVKGGDEAMESGEESVKGMDEFMETGKVGGESLMMGGGDTLKGGSDTLNGGGETLNGGEGLRKREVVDCVNEEGFKVKGSEDEKSMNGGVKSDKNEGDSSEVVGGVKHE